VEHTDDVAMSPTNELVGLREEDLNATEFLRVRAALADHDGMDEIARLMALTDDIGSLPDPVPSSDDLLQRVYEQARERAVLLSIALCIEIADVMLLVALT
jgi:hypothetical protein